MSNNSYSYNDDKKFAKYLIKNYCIANPKYIKKDLIEIIH